MRCITSQSGLTLTELLIGMALGTMALLGLASLTGYGIGVNANLISASKLHEESYAVMQLIDGDLRRAGFSGDTVDMVTDPAANPSPFADSIATGAYPGEDPNSCILFSYDANQNGVLDAGAGGENFGFRLRSGRVEMRTNDLGCEEDNWIGLTTTNQIDVEQLTFIVVQTIDTGIPVTNITVNMVTEDAANGSISRRLTSQILVQNYDG